MKFSTVLWVSVVMAFTPLSMAQAEKLKMESTKIDQPIAIDGKVEDAWNKADSLEVTVDELPYKPNNGYEGITETDVEIRSLYDETHIYFLVRYEDPTLSLERFPWVKHSDGSWKQLKNLDDTRHDNTYYEDKVAFLWNINEKGFKKKGCDASCHIAENGIVDGVEDYSAGRHFTQVGETLDAWHWKSARTNAVFQVDDQYFNWTKKDENPKGWGRHGDHKTGGGYYNNVNADKSAPAWMNTRAGDGPVYWVREDDKVAFNDRFEPGNIVGGIVARAFTGSRGDLTGRGEWKDGVWTLEIKRKLVTTGEDADTQDVQFDDLSKSYLFGITVFDNAQINHIYHKKPITLTFAD